MNHYSRTNILTWSLGIFLIIVFIYGIYRMYPLFIGASITVYSPMDGEVVASTTFQVSGKVERAREIKIQGKPITINTENIFTETLISHYPYTLIVIEATDKYGKITRKTLQVTPK